MSTVGEDGRVPPSNHPVTPLPPPVDEAYELVRSPARIAIVKWLAGHPRSLVSEIVAGVGGQRIMVRSHLEALETVGAVVGDHASGERARMRVRYTLQTARVRELTDRLTDYLNTPE